jgi:hypothetical protein
MALDYSKLSDEELQAIQDQDYSKLSDETLKQISEDPSMNQTANPAPSEPPSTAENVRNAAVGAGAALYGAGQSALHTPGGQVLAGLGAYKAAPSAYQYAKNVAKSVPQAARTMGNFMSGAGQGVVPPSNIPPGATSSPSWTAPSAPEAPPSSANYMSRMTQLADRYLPAAKSAAGTVGKVVAPVARVLSSAPVIGAQLMAHSPQLNTGEAAELARRQQMQPTITPQQ